MLGYWLQCDILFYFYQMEECCAVFVNSFVDKYSESSFENYFGTYCKQMANMITEATLEDGYTRTFTTDTVTAPNTPCPRLHVSAPLTSQQQRGWRKSDRATDRHRSGLVHITRPRSVAPNCLPSFVVCVHCCQRCNTCLLATAVMCVGARTQMCTYTQTRVIVFMSLTPCFSSQIHIRTHTHRHTLRNCWSSFIYMQNVMNRCQPDLRSPKATGHASKKEVLVPSVFLGS